VSLFARQPATRVLDTALSMLQLFRRGEPLTLMPNVFVR
jgi:hypothetical protein